MESRDSMMGKDARISKSKGKGKESARFVSKLSASASGLLQDALGNLGANDLQHAISSGGKLSSDSSPNSPSYWLQELPVRSPGTTVARQSNSLDPGFRSTASQHDHNLEFEEFVESSGSSTPDLNFYRAESAARTNHRTFDLNEKDGSPLNSTELETSALQPYLAESRSATSSLVREPPYTADSEGASIHEERDKTLSNAHLESLSHSQFGPFHQQGHGGFIPESIQADGHSLTRLRMILDHISDTAQLLSPYQDLALSQVERTNFRHHHYSALGGLDQMSFEGPDFQPSSEIVAQRTSDQKCTKERKSDRESVDERITPPFHCPWIRCHQRFNDAAKLSSHDNEHTQYSCVHDDCVAQFSTRQNWIEHIAKPHHDLQEGSFPMTLVSSGGTICAVAATATGMNNRSGAANS